MNALVPDLPSTFSFSTRVPNGFTRRTNALALTFFKAFKNPTTEEKSEKDGNRNSLKRKKEEREGERGREGLKKNKTDERKKLALSKFTRSFAFSISS